MATDIIREFLVSIGFQVDQSGAKKADKEMDRRTADSIKRDTDRRKKQVKAISDSVRTITKVFAGMATAATVGIGLTTRALDDLYWTSQRVKASAGNIKAFSYGVAQMGGDAKSAMASLEGLASFIRTNPGGENWLRNFGIETRNANGTERDRADMMADLADKFRAMPYSAAAVRAQFLGIDEKTLMAMIAGTEEFGARYKQIAKEMGVDADKAAKSGMQLARVIRELQFRMELAWYKVVQKIEESGFGETLARVGRMLIGLFGVLARVGERLFEWFVKLDRATDGWATKLGVLVAILGPILILLDPIVLGVMALAAGLVLLWDDYQTWREGGDSLINWAGWSKEIESAIAAMENLGGAIMTLLDYAGDLAKAFGELFGPALMFAARFFITGVIGLFQALSEAIFTVVSLLKGDMKGAWSHAKKFAAAMIGGGMQPGATPGGDGKAEYDREAASDIQRARVRAVQIMAGVKGAGSGEIAALTETLKRNGDAALAAQLQGKAPAPVANDNGRTAAVAGAQGAVAKAFAFFRSQGWSPEQAAGLVANLRAENRNLDPHQKQIGGGPGYGLAQWEKPRQREFAKLFGKDIRESTFEEQLAFIQHELTTGMEAFAGKKLKGATTAYEAGDAVARYYERPKNLERDAALRGRSAEAMLSGAQLTGRGAQTVVINADTKIDVHGGDAGTTGRAVAGEQSRVYGDMLRNTKSKLG